MNLEPKAMMSPIVSLRGVRKAYRRGSQSVAALSTIDLDIVQGDFVAMMGPSGSGKTTLLNLIGGLDLPTAGEVVVAGVRINRLSASELSAWRGRTIGFVFQFYNLMPMLSAEHNVELPLLLTTLSRPQRRKHVHAALELVGLLNRRHHRPAQLSGGEQQRIAIARAIVADPPLLVCDEPTGDLDRETATGVLELLQLLNREFGKSIMMVTHDPKAAGFATSALQLDKGCLVPFDAELLA